MSTYQIDATGTRRWQLNGKLHRADGPAVEYSDGDQEWWLDGQHLTQEQHHSMTALYCWIKSYEHMLGNKNTV